MARNRKKGPKYEITKMTNQQKIRSLRLDRNHPVQSQWTSINNELLKTKKDLAKLKEELAKTKEELARAQDGLTRAQDELAKLKGE